MNSLFVILNQKCNLYSGTLTFTLRGFNAKAMFCKKVQTFTVQNLAVFWIGDPLIVNLKAPNPKRHVYQSEHDFFAPLSVQFHVLADKTEKKAGEEESQKLLYFIIMWGCHFATDLN